jgi:hypothetical protein
MWGLIVRWRLQTHLMQRRFRITVVKAKSRRIHELLYQMQKRMAAVGALPKVML